MTDQNTVWDAICVYEDGDITAAHEIVKALSDSDVETFEDECDRIRAKRDRAAEYDIKEAVCPVINCPMTVKE